MDNTQNMRPADQGDKPKFLRGLFLWLQQVAADPTLPPEAARLAIVLASFVNQHSGDAWPTQETLANALGVSIRTVRRTINEMIARGHLEVVTSRGWHRPNSYRPTRKDRTTVSGLDPERPDNHDRPSARADRTSDDRETGHLTSQTGHLTTERPDKALSPRTIDRTIDYRTIEGTIERADARESDHPDRIGHGDRSEKKLRRRHQERADGFDEFYRVYPRHVARGAAERAYGRIIRKGEATPTDLLNGAMRYAAEREGEPERYTKHPATWLNGQCWKDAPATAATRSGGYRPSVTQQVINGARRAMENLRAADDEAEMLQ